jgi:hypothetical protein
MNLGKLLGTGKSFVSGHNLATYRADKRVYVPQFVSPKNPFANPAPAQTEAPKPATENLFAPAKKTAAPISGAPARTSGWISKLNPISIFNAADSFANKNATPVQVELSLEKVKVVHNDLTDADVEIVPMKSRPARGAANVPAKKSWAALGEQIMKATAL